MPFRKLTNEELVSHIEKLQEMVAWLKVNEFANKFFPAATKITYDVEGESDDEGGADYFARNVSAYDKDGEEIILSEFKDDDGTIITDEDEIHDIMSDMTYSLPTDKRDYNPEFDLTKSPLDELDLYIYDETLLDIE